ncbi:MAG: c-type cytochrome [Pirellulaceae bacterium]
MLSQWLHSEPEIQVASIRRIANLDAPQRTPFLGQLVSIAIDEQQEASVRADALFALANVQWKDTQFLMSLLTDANDDIAIEAARTLRSWLARDRHPQLNNQLAQLTLRPVVAERLQLPSSGQNRSEDEWRDTLLSAKGSEERGRRVFLDTRSQCRQCHSLNGKGGVLGPDLSNVGKSKSKAQIVDAILHPSNDFAPQYQAWIVYTSDGKSHRGLQLDHKTGGAIVLTLDDGSNRRFSAAEIEGYEASPTSLMPRGLLDLLTPGEAIDLVTFLSKSAD